MSSGVAYPTGGDYQEALFNTTLCFKDPYLRTATVETSAQGLPRPISGNFASVFTLRGNDGRRWALKCFTRAVDDRAVRYEEISKALTATQGAWQVAFDYLPEGILCRGSWFPVVKMEWVEAIPLISYLDRNFWDTEKVTSLALGFASIVQDLTTRGIAHGDLQHGNLLVTPAGALKLVDYDGMFVPALGDLGGIEKGHINYQSPLREVADWGPHLDNFSAWVIYTSLVCLTLEPSLWMRLHKDGDEALIFHASDFLGRAGAPALLALSQSGSESVRRLASAWDALYVGRLQDIPALDSKALPEPTPAVAFTQGSAESIIVPGSLPDWLLAAIEGVSPGGTEGAQEGAFWLGDHVPATPPLQLDRPGRVMRWLVRGLLALAVLLLVLGAVSSAAGDAGSAILPMFLGGAVSLGGFEANQQSRARRRQNRLRRDARLQQKRTSRDVANVSARRTGAVTSLHAAEQAAARQLQGIGAKEAEDQRRSQQQLQIQLSHLAHRQQELQQAIQQDLANALRSSQEQHLQQHLRSMTLDRVRLEGFGPQLVRALRSIGIISAADFRGFETHEVVYLRLSSGRLIHVRGIGEIKAITLESWRRGCEQQALASMPTSIPEIAADQIRKHYQDRLWRLDNEQRGMEHIQASEQAAITRRSVEERVNIRVNLDELRQRSAAILASLDAEMLDARKRHAQAEWQLSRAERDCEAFSNISYHRYLLMSIWR